MATADTTGLLTLSTSNGDEVECANMGGICDDEFVWTDSTSGGSSSALLGRCSAMYHAQSTEDWDQGMMYKTHTGTFEYFDSECYLQLSAEITGID